MVVHDGVYFGDGGLHVGSSSLEVGSSPPQPWEPPDPSPHRLAYGGGSLSAGRAIAANGSFAFGDNSSGTPVIAENNSFIVRATGLVNISGVSLDPGGGAWNNVSDARKKTDWQSADPEFFLRGIAGLPIRSWRYAAQAGTTRHVGPTSQDFRGAFGLGSSDTTISTVDADGVSMLAIQALARRTDELHRANRELEERLAALEALLGKKD